MDIYEMLSLVVELARKDRYELRRKEQIVQ